MARRVRARLEWHGPAFSKNLNSHLRMRMVSVAEYLRDTVQDNISIPVEYTSAGVIRSKPGEFPRMDTAKLIKSIRADVVSRPMIEARVSAGPDYTLKLERQLNRAFLTRTLFDEIPVIQSIFTSPMNLTAASASGSRGRPARASNPRRGFRTTRSRRKPGPITPRRGP